MNEATTILTRAAVQQAFHRACIRAGLADMRFHDLRHEGVSRLFEHGLNVVEVAAISGHRTLSQLSRYAHAQTMELIRKLG